MFTDLMPLLRKRGLLLTVSLVEGDALRVTVLPQKASESDDKSTTSLLPSPAPQKNWTAISHTS